MVCGVVLCVVKGVDSKGSLGITVEGKITFSVLTSWQK